MYNAQIYRSNWWGFIGKKILIAVIALWIISFIFFTLTVLPFPFDRGFHSESPIITKEQHQQVIHEYHLMDNVFTRYFYWVGGIIRGDFGNSSIFRTPAKE